MAEESAFAAQLASE